MLNKNIFFDCMDSLLMAYPNWKINLGERNTSKFWYEQFQHMGNAHFEHMINSYIKTEKFNPTIAGLKEHDTLPKKSIDQIRHEQMLRDIGYHD